MFFHFGFILLVSFLGIVLKDYKEIYLYITFFLFFIMSGFRHPSIGNDTFTYYRIFLKAGTTSWRELGTANMELGYLVLNKFLYNVSTDPIILTVTTSFLFLYALFRIISKYSKIPWFSLFLFINMRFFYFSLSGIRQTISITILFFSFHYLLNNDKIKFIVSVLFASFFHLTSLVFLVNLLVINKDYDKGSLFKYILFSIISISFFDLIILIILKYFPKYQVYLGGQYFNTNKEGLILELLLHLIFWFFLLYTSRWEKDSTLHDDLMFHMFNISVVIQILALKFALLSRISMYFSMFSILLIPNKIKKYRKKDRMLLLLLVTIIMLLYNFTILNYRPNWQNVYPFKLRKIAIF